MKNPFKAFFTCTSGERRGTLALIILVLSVTGLELYYAVRQPEGRHYDDSDLLRELEALEKNAIQTGEIANDHAMVSHEEVFEETDLFFFDPNQVNKSELISLGLPAQLANRLINYRSKGGRFYCKEDLRKVYGMRKECYNRIAPYVRISSDVAIARKSDFPDTTHKIIDLNDADSSSLTGLPGIGPVLAQRIIRYRYLIGGFYDIAQLQEVYGINDSLFAVIMPLISADSFDIKRISLNRASEYELARHPYIGKYTAHGIVKYRTYAKEIKNMNELIDNGLIDKKVWKKSRIYLTL
jgi:DNA uptake protein ComE-like DNA-binding protein